MASADVRDPLLNQLQSVEVAQHAPLVPETVPQPHSVQQGFVDLNPPAPAPAQSSNVQPLPTPVPSAPSTFPTQPSFVFSSPSTAGYVFQWAPPTSSTPSSHLPNQPSNQIAMPAPGQPWEPTFYCPAVANYAQPQEPPEFIIAQQHVFGAEQARQVVGWDPNARRVRHCAKCGKPQQECRGAQKRDLCLNPCQFCQRKDCRGRDTSVKGSKCPNAPR